MKRGKWFFGVQVLKRMLAASVLAAVFVLSLDAGQAFASDKEGVTARPSVDGQLSVEGTDIVNEKGEVVQLKGVSLHGITWFPDFINESLFNQVSVDWDANLIRVPVYSDVYPDSREDCLALTKKAIDAAVAADMYVIVDWHVLEDKDPNVCIDYARDFFNTIVPEYAGVPNILYEICNEPNGETTWTDVRDYAYYIIPTIRQFSPDSIIIVGTPNYCKDLNSQVRNPLKIDNVVYSLHFYAATHKEDLRREYESALRRGLPVFIS
jgi:cellulose synthase (UDP-forming)